MRDGGAAANDWAAARRYRWSASRIAAAIALHALVLVALTLAIDRVELPRPGADRATTLVTVALHAAPPPPLHALPPPKPARTPRVPDAPAPARARDAEPQAIALPAAPAPAVLAATPPASAPPDLKFLDDAATRQAIRAVARGDTLASHGNALTHEEPGTELVAADGSHCNCKRNLPPPPPAVALAQGIEAAHKGDCMKGDYAGTGMGLLSAPFFLAAEALGKCAHKL